jgi:uncharacterized protein
MEPNQSQKLALAVNAIVANAVTNDRAIQASRMAAAFPNGSIDSKRSNAWCSFGFPENPQFEFYHNLYERYALANAAVSRLNDNCFRTEPEVIQGLPESRATAATAWEKKFTTLAKRVDLWEKLREADKRRLVGRYSGLILKVRDSKMFKDELGKIGEAQLVGLIPAWEGQLTVTEWNTDELSEFYGDPKMYHFIEAPTGGSPGRNVEVHPSRVIILGDLRDGTNFLAPGLNSLINIFKITGSGAEGMVKVAARQLGINFDVGTDLEGIVRASGAEALGLQGLFDEVTTGMNSGIDQTIVTQGATVTPLASAVPDPKNHFDINLQEFSASVDIPSKILVGNQAGSLASDQDQKYMNKRCQGRRIHRLTPDIEYIIKRLTDCGVLKSTESSVLWDDLTESSQSERFATAKTLAEICQMLIATGDAPFTAEEIRETAGFSAIPTGDPLGEDMGDDPLADEPPADPLAQ